MEATFLLAGQSNAERWLVTGNGAATEAFSERFLALNPEFSSVRFVDAARGGSAILKTSAEARAEPFRGNPPKYDWIAENHWFDETSGAFGRTHRLESAVIRAEVNAGTVFQSLPGKELSVFSQL